MTPPLHDPPRWTTTWMQDAVATAAVKAGIVVPHTQFPYFCALLTDAANAETERQRTWQPIATAPTDCEFLVCWSDGQMETVGIGSLCVVFRSFGAHGSY